MSWLDMYNMVYKIMGWWDMYDTVYHFMACCDMYDLKYQVWHGVTCMTSHIKYAIYVMVYKVIT